MAQRVAAGVIAGYLRFVWRCTRWRVEVDAASAGHLASGAVIFAFWHEMLPVVPQIWMRTRRHMPERRAAALASRHRDGRLIGAVLAQFGVAMVYGSTAAEKGGVRQERGGAAALRALLGVLAQGDGVVITPDGPRGPARRAAKGVAQLAAISGAPVVAAAGCVRFGVRLSGWDRMMLPLPFGRGVLVCGAPVMVARGAEDAGLAAIEAALAAACARAAALCGR